MKQALLALAAFLLSFTAQAATPFKKIGACSTLSVSGTPGSLALNSNGDAMYVTASVDAYINWGSGANTANTTTSLKLPAGAVQTFGYDGTGGGSLYYVGTSGTLTVCFGTGE